MTVNYLSTELKQLKKISTSHHGFLAIIFFFAIYFPGRIYRIDRLGVDVPISLHRNIVPHEDVIGSLYPEYLLKAGNQHVLAPPTNNLPIRTQTFTVSILYFTRKRRII